MAGKVNSSPGEIPKVAEVRVAVIGDQASAGCDNPQDIEPALLAAALRELADDIARTDDRTAGLW